MNYLVRKLAIAIGALAACMTAVLIAASVSMSVFADAPTCRPDQTSTPDVPCSPPPATDATPTPPAPTPTPPAPTPPPAGGDAGSGGGATTGGSGTATPPPVPTTPDPGSTGSGDGDTGSGGATGGTTTTTAIGGDGSGTTGGGTTGGGSGTTGGGSPSGGSTTTTTVGAGTSTGTTTHHHHHAPAAHHHGGSGSGSATHHHGAGSDSGSGGNGAGSATTGGKPATGAKPASDAAAAEAARAAARATGRVAAMHIDSRGFVDARTFRDTWKPEGRLPEAPQLDNATMAAVAAAATASGIDWPLLTALAWTDSRWGDPSAGVFIGQHLTAADWTTYGTDGNADGAVDHAAIPDQLATVAARLAAVPGSDEDRLRAYLGDRPKMIDRALLIGAYHNALGQLGIEKGLSDPTVATDLQQRVLADQRVRMYPGGTGDVKAGIIDPRVLVSIEFLADRFHSVTVSCLVSGHSVFTSSGNISLHAYGQAVDIAALNDVSIYGHQVGTDSITVLALKDLLRLPQSMQPKELISLWALGGPSFALTDHDDHIHLGFGSAVTGTAAVPVGSGVEH